MSPDERAAEHGRFVWYELLSTDPQGAVAFYPAVTGWKPEQVTIGAGPYTMWVGAQGPLGGVGELPATARAMGAPSFWQANVEVADVDLAVAEIARLGGQVYVVEDVAGIGRFAIVADPQGAVFAVFTPARVMPTQDVTRPGEFAWHELYTTDLEAAFSFYQRICGWERLGAVGRPRRRTLVAVAIGDPRGRADDPVGSPGTAIRVAPAP